MPVGRADAPWLRVIDRKGWLLPSPEEEADARLSAEARAERETRRAEQETTRAEREAERAAMAEAEVARLRALLKGQGDG